MYHTTPAPSIIDKKPITLKEKVFAKLLAEEENQYCFDCGWQDPTHVSINHGIFLCTNCATGIHVEHYPVEISYIMSIDTDEFNYLQLRVLINGGNKAAFDFFEVYDLQNDPVQKRYNTCAAKFYRDKIKGMLEQTSNFLFKQDELKAPDLSEGRLAVKSEKKGTDQNRPYTSLNHREILQELLSWEHIDFPVDANFGELDGRDMRVAAMEARLLGKFDKYMQEKEGNNSKLHENIKQLKKTSYKNKKKA